MRWKCPSCGESVEGLPFTVLSGHPFCFACIASGDVVDARRDPAVMRRCSRIAWAATGQIAAAAKRNGDTVVFGRKSVQVSLGRRVLAPAFE